MKIIYPIIVIISLFVCYHFFKKSKTNSSLNNKIVENFNTTDYNDPQFKFFNVLNDIKTSDKIVLDNVQSKCYLTRQTIDTDLKTKVNNILKRVISELNNVLQKNEYYVNDIEGLYIIKDDKNNYRIITISMLHDVKNYYSVKFVMDLVYLNNKYC